MKRAVVGLVVVAISAILVATGWGIYGKRIRTTLALRKCARSWENLKDYKGDFQVNVELGPLTIAAGGTLTFMKPDSYKLEFGGGHAPDCHVMVSGDRAWVYFPDRQVAFEVEFGREDVASLLGKHSLEPWVDQLGEGTEIEWAGTETVGGRACSVLELVPPQEVKENGVPVILPALGKKFELVPFLARWKRTRIYLDKKTGLPIRGDALKDSGSALFTWTASKVETNRGLTANDFEFQAPNSVKLRKRKYDPEHPERLFEPPEKGRSFLDKLGDALEGEAKDYLRRQFGAPGSDEPGGGALGKEVFDALADEL